MKEFTLFWLTGHAEVITGKDITEAVNKHYGGGAMRALDFWSHGDERDKYIWNRIAGEWQRKQPL